VTNLLVLVIVLVLTAWLGSLLIQFEREVAAARRRTRTAWDKVEKLETLIAQLQTEEASLTEQLAHQSTTISGLQHQVSAIQTELAALRATGGNRLLVLSSRRNPGDRDWIVTLSNPAATNDGTARTLAKEWLVGREYLVFAKSDPEARERALRRFASRPAMIVKACHPAPATTFTSSSAQADA
jgi:hypothetical protein